MCCIKKCHTFVYVNGFRISSLVMRNEKGIPCKPGTIPVAVSLFFLIDNYPDKEWDND